MTKTRSVYIESDIRPPDPSKVLQCILTSVEMALLDCSSVQLIFSRPLLQGVTFRKRPSRPTVIRFPGKKECWKFNPSISACYVRLFRLILDNLNSGTVTTRRDLYYKDVALFRNQATIDALIEQLCDSLGVKGSDLGVFPSQKGLIFGSISIIYKNLVGKECCYQLSSSEKSQLTPNWFSNDVEILSVRIPPTIRCVIVLEKDAVFKRLCESSWAQDQYILVTGKGYPDHLTRQFLDLMMKHTSLKVYGFFDSDIYGLLIANTYKYGTSQDLNKMLLEKNRLQWAGVEILDYTQGHQPVRPKEIQLMTSLNHRLGDRIKLLTKHREGERCTTCHTKSQISPNRSNIPKNLAKWSGTTLDIVRPSATPEKVPTKILRDLLDET
ncbi:Meiosis-specific protein [Komagataella phaffii CBS 7435]|uniref:DNA topoisomerase (ATP-hydrolyzing) n=1 Tax=Komagataella phaffii (strain ATCC 76273 / CBS 7435 / CECT 11047 / NRRL Y-11430 / Wegner 21-1) TaxID=981350 RepID=F2QLJ7_KOMPC|nr:Meiosis-specific protein [Komagataella phaffii CBS 7435]CCA37089.1 Meiosis-specific protein [Komagataella phaffii CBS 7435]